MSNDNAELDELRDQLESLSNKLRGFMEAQRIMAENIIGPQRPDLHLLPGGGETTPERASLLSVGRAS